MWNSGLKVEPIPMVDPIAIGRPHTHWKTPYPLEDPKNIVDPIPMVDPTLMVDPMPIGRPQKHCGPHEYAVIHTNDS